MDRNHSLPCGAIVRITQHIPVVRTHGRNAAIVIPGELGQVVCSVQDIDRLMSKNLWPVALECAKDQRLPNVVPIDKDRLEIINSSSS